MTRTWAAWVAAAGLAFAGGCSLSLAGGDSPAPLESGVRIWVPTLVWWDAGEVPHLTLAIENGTPRTVTMAEPDPAYVRVGVFPGPEGLRVCGVEPHAAQGAPRRRIALAPGGSVALRVDLGAACAGLPPGAYRFEVDYEAPPVDGAFSGALATRYGELNVEGAPEQAQAQAQAQAEERPPPRRAGRAPPHRRRVR